MIRAVEWQRRLPPSVTPLYPTNGLDGTEAGALGARGSKSRIVVPAVELWDKEADILAAIGAADAKGAVAFAAGGGAEIEERSVFVGGERKSKRILLRAATSGALAVGALPNGVSGKSKKRVREYAPVERTFHHSSTSFHIPPRTIHSATAPPPLEDITDNMFLRRHWTPERAERRRRNLEKERITHARYRQQLEMERLRHLAVNRRLPNLSTTAVEAATVEADSDASGGGGEDGRGKRVRTARASASTTLPTPASRGLRSRERLKLSHIRMADLQAPAAVADQLGLAVVPDEFASMHSVGALLQRVAAATSMPAGSK